MAFITASRVAGSTRDEPCTTLDTVVWDTLARRATSRLVADLCSAVKARSVLGRRGRAPRTERTLLEVRGALPGPVPRTPRAARLVPRPVDHQAASYTSCRPFPHP